MNQRGAIPIIVALFMLSGAVAIGLSVATVQTDRLQLTRRDTVVTETEQESRSKREEIIFTINTEEVTIDDVYVSGGDGSGPKTDCDADDWQREGEVEFCIKNVDGYTYEVQTSILDYDIVRKTELTIPDSCVPSQFYHGFGRQDCPTSIATKTYNFGYFFLSLHTCTAPRDWHRDYYYNTYLFDSEVCAPEDCRPPPRGAHGVLVEIVTATSRIPLSWRMYQCGSEYTAENSVFSGEACEYCPFGTEKEILQGHPVIPDGTYNYCEIPKYFRDARYVNGDVYAQSFDGPVCLSSVAHGYQGSYGEGTPFCEGECNVSWSMWDSELAETGQWTMHTARYAADEPATRSCQELHGFNPQKFYEADENNLLNTESARCQIGTPSCSATEAICQNGECEELRFSCVPNPLRDDSQVYKWARYADATCKTKQECGVSNCIKGYGMIEHRACGPKLEGFLCFKEYQSWTGNSILLQCTREKNGWTIVPSNESVFGNPSPLVQTSGGKTIWNKIACGGFTDQEWGYTDFNDNGELLSVTCPERFSCIDPLGNFEDGDTNTLVSVDCRDVSPCTDERPIYNRVYSECCPIGVDPAYVGTVDPSLRAETNCVSLENLPAT